MVCRQDRGKPNGYIKSRNQGQTLEAELARLKNKIEAKEW
jgi:hypothetical protein